MSKNDNRVATKQAGVSPLSGVAPPKERQFGQPNGNPRNNGAWKKEDTPRYQMEQLYKMSVAEIKEIANDENAPIMKRRIARSLLKENEFKTTEAMVNQVYGTPKNNMKTELEISGELNAININVKRYDGGDEK